MVDCPVCKNAMITLELQDVEIDHCTHCGGIWLDAGELELLMDDPLQAKKLLDSFEVDTTSTEKHRKCPICLKKMQKILVGKSDPPLRIDKCRRADGLWFDSDELAEILARAQIDENNKIQKILADMFAADRNSAAGSAGTM